MATFVMNEKREFIVNIEKRHGVHVLIIANPYLHLPQYTMTRLKEDNVGNKNKKPSYTLIQQPDLDIPHAHENHKKADEPIVKPYDGKNAVKPKEAGFFERLWQAIVGDDEGIKKQSVHQTKVSSHTKHQHNHEKRPQTSANRRRRPMNNHLTTGGSAPRPPAAQPRKKSTSTPPTGRVASVKTDAVKRKTGMQKDVEEG